MAEIKGILLNGWMKFLKDRYGEGAVSNALGGLSPEDRRLVPAIFLDASWYAFDALHALRKLTRPLIQRTDGDITVEIGRYMAQHAFTGVYKPLLANDPIKQVQKFTASQVLRRRIRSLRVCVRMGSCRLLIHRKSANPTRQAGAVSKGLPPCSS
jgi:hypothetical protein